MKPFTIYLMRYAGGTVESTLPVIPYQEQYYEQYRELYHRCYRAMRTALERHPIDCCDSREELNLRQEEIFLLTEGETIIGSVWIHGNEIDDLLVSPDFQHQGYGGKLLNFAISRMQKQKIEDIQLHVVDWNRTALHLYRKSGFIIADTLVLGK